MRRIVAWAMLMGCIAAACPDIGRAQTTYSEDFTQATTTNPWYFSNGACLTAGTSTSTTSPGVIPSCLTVFSSYYSQPHFSSSGTSHADTAMVGGANGVAGGSQTLPDPVGQGALRFTNGYTTTDPSSGINESGAIYSRTPFNAGSGIAITFKTVTYRGNSGGAGLDGADGLSFFLIDATKVTPGDGIFNGLGSSGGSLGYTCSNGNVPSDGLTGAYLGLGIDEYGNFMNGTSITPYGNAVPGPIRNFGDNTASGYGYVPERIGLRGLGSISYAALAQAYPTYYNSTLFPTSTLQQAAVRSTCANGTVVAYVPLTNSFLPVLTMPVNDYSPIPNGTVTLTTAGLTLANESDVARPTGKTTLGVTDGNIFLYSLKITQNGLLNFSYSINGSGVNHPVITNQSITAQNGSLPAKLYFGFAGSTGGSTNIHEIMCFQAAPVTQSASSAAGDQKQVAAVQATTQDYFAYYDPNDFTGRLTAYPLIDTNGVITINSLAAWDAQCVLTGTTNCVNTGVAGPTSPEAPTSRTMVTLNGTNTDTTANVGTAGIPFEWASLTTNEQLVLDAGDTLPINANRVSWLRGDRSKEINSAGVGTFRARNGVLGDIVDSSPAWVGPPSSPYAIAWKDRLATSTTMPENSGVNYVSFQTTNQSRQNVVYAGANDGFLHGFRAGTEDVNGNLSGTNDGYELFAYMPGAVLNTVHNAVNTSLDLSNPLYSHNFFVDATPGTGDLYYGSAWHTWLVGGLGMGGAAIYALDITSPSNFTESNAANLVKGEWSAATLSCAGNGTSPATCGLNLGKTYGTPQIRRLHNGTWGAIFGNGFGSSTGDAGIYIMSISQTSGAITFYYLSTGTAGSSNGIAYVAPADLDGDHITDYVYAGDLNGNVWRFDLTSATASNWGVTTLGGVPNPLFKTQAGQPITTQLVVASALATGTTPRVMVAFGTGQRTQFTNTSAATYIAGQQALYGVWDWNLSAWNAVSSAPYASLTQAQYSTATSDTTAPYTLGQSNLTAQTFTAASTAATTAAGTAQTPVTTSNATVTFVTCTTSCTPGTTFGWYANLNSTQGATNSAGATLNEQIVSTPTLYQGAILVNSSIPANFSVLSCSVPSTDTGVLYAVSVATGGTLINGGGSTSNTYSSVFTAYKDTQTVGIPTNETGTVSVVNTKENTTYAVAQNIVVNQGSSPGQAVQIAVPNNIAVNRTTWVELR